jgi:opacity protein-like surface antigen
MKHFKYLRGSILGLALVSASSIAQAADAGQAYFSGYLGNTDVDVDGFSGSDMSFRIGGGYQLNRNIAVEGFYINYGEAEDRGYTIEATALQFQGVAMLPVSPAVDLYGKLGLALWDGEACGNGCVSNDGNDIVFGFGGAFDVSKKVAIRAEYELADFDDADFNTIMVGVDIAF